MSDPISIIIADDHPLTRSGLVEWVKRNPRYLLVAEVENGREAWEAIERHTPDMTSTGMRTITSPASLPWRSTRWASRNTRSPLPGSFTMAETYQGRSGVSWSAVRPKASPSPPPVPPSDEE